MSTKMMSGHDRLENLSAGKAQLLRLLVEKERQQTRKIGRDPRRDTENFLPTSWQQQRLWFIDQLEGSAAGYQVPVALRVHGRFDKDSLQKSLDAIVRRHETLRTTFVNVDGEPKQVVAPQGQFPLLLFDLSGHDVAECEAQVRSHEADETYGKFDLTVGPLARGRLLKLAAEEHLLIVTIHHIIVDGWSKGVFLRELALLYRAAREGLEVSMEPLPLQYADYAFWQQQWLLDKGLSAQLDYWRQQLRGVAPQLDLPTDRQRPPAQSYRGENVQFHLDPRLTGKLNALAKEHDVTLFMLLYAGIAILLSRLSGQEDVVMGTPVANRQRPELEGLVGLFVNTLVLRTDVDEGISLEEFLRRIKSVTLAAYENQDVPFDQVVKALRPERNLSRNPLFQVAFVLQNAPRSDMHFPDATALVENVVNEPAILDLVLVLEERDEALEGIVNFAKDIFDRGTVERWIACFTNLLEDMVSNSRRCVGQLSILPEYERTQIVDAYNSSLAATWSLDRQVHDLFEEQVRKTPRATAVEHNGRSITYDELNRQADHLARQLVKRGAGPNRLVGICSERGIDMVIALLGTLKAGGAYVPLDPTYPRERLAHMLEDASPHVVLTQLALAGLLPVSQAQVVVLDELLVQNSSDAEQLSECRPGSSPADLVYVIYTSGSTGRPKGTAMAHRSMVNLIEWHRRSFGVGEQRVLQFAALSFDVAFQETFSTLCTGGTLVLLDEWIRRDPAALASFLNRYSIERLFLPPMMLQGLAEHCQADSMVLGSLKDVIAAGEQLRVTPEVRRFFERLTNSRLHNHYGPTETHVVTALTLAGNPSNWPATPSIGQPLSNVRIYILDKRCQSVPIGVSGEIYIGGASVAREYLRQPDLTSARFIPDPFADEPAARMYRSGDVGRWRHDGTIDYLGRNDDQVKLRGYRVELGEIEAQLRRHDQVKEAVVAVREDGPGGKQLVAYLTSRRGESVPSAERLRTHLTGILPEHMIPSAFVVMTNLPLTPTGKLNRRALPAPDLDAYVSRHYEAPIGETEEVLALVWCELLQMERIGRLDNFFELGGHSMLGMKLIARLAERFAIRLPAIAVFRYPTLERMAAEIDSLMTIEANSMKSHESEMEEGVI